MNSIQKEEKKEYLSWKSLKQLPHFWDFVNEQEYCHSCIGWEVDDEILDRAQLYKDYTKWYKENY